jgi:MFS family permease
VLTEAYRRPAATGPARRRDGVHPEASRGSRTRSDVAPAAVTAGAIAVLTTSAGLALLGAGVVGAAVPTVQAPFGAGGGWVAAAYSIPLALALTVSGRLADRAGAERLLRIGLLALAATALLSALAPNLQSLVALRALEGAAAGMLPATALALLLRVAPRRHLGVAVGVFAAGALLLPAAGPLLGAAPPGWREVPVGLAVLALVAARASLAVLPRSASGDRRRIDVAGLVSGGVGLVLVLLALAGAPSWGWGSPPTVLLGLGGAAALAVFTVVELAAEEPLVDLDPFRDPTTAVATVLLVMLVACLGAGFLEAPSLLHQALGGGGPIAWPPFVTGVLAAAALPLAGRAGDRIGPRWPAASGLVLVAYSTFLLRLTGPGTAGWWVGALAGLRGVGMGMALAAVLTTALAGIPRGGENRAAAAVVALLRLPAAIGLAVLVAVSTAPRPATRVLDAAPLQAPVAWVPLRAVLLVTAGVTALGAILALRLPSASVEGGLRLDLGGIVAAITGTRRRSVSLVGLRTRPAPPALTAPAEPAARPRRPRTTPAVRPRARAATAKGTAQPTASSRPRRSPAPRATKAAGATPAAPSRRAPARPSGTPSRRRVEKPDQAV